MSAGENKSHPTPFAHSNLDAFQVAVTVVCIATIVFGLERFEKSSIFEVTLFCALQIFLNVTQYNVVMHNFIHTPFFKSARLNRAYELLCGIPVLATFTESKNQHLTHHRYANDKIDQQTGTTKDPTSTYRYGTNGAHEAFLSYICLGPFRELVESSDQQTTKRDTAKIRWEMSVIIATLLTLFWFNYKFALLYLLIVYVSLALILAENYFEHYGATPGHRLLNSVSCYGVFYNRIWFNNGYHQEHHFKPAIHWTRLKNLRQEMPQDDKRRIVPYAHFLNLPGLRRNAAAHDKHVARISRDTK
jgi:fatty acid desaturase